MKPSPSVIEATKPKMVETRSQHAGRITQRNATIVVNTNVNNEPTIRASTLGNQNQSSLKQHVMTGILPGRKAVCFYCGRRSAQRLKTTAREWECEKCLAVNYLDEVRRMSSDLLSPGAFCGITDDLVHRMATLLILLSPSRLQQSDMQCQSHEQTPQNEPPWKIRSSVRHA